MNFAFIILRHYTPEEFLAQFGGSFVNNTHPACESFKEKYGTVFAKEEAMRAQLEKEKAKPTLSIIQWLFQNTFGRIFCS